MADAIPLGWEVETDPPALAPFNFNRAADLARRWGTVTSAGRTPEHNRRVGGVDNSFHLVTRPGGARALDIERRKGVRHADIEADYRAAGFDLLESLDEGDHSHLAFRAGPSTPAPQQTAVPDGWEIERPVATKPPPPKRPEAAPRPPLALAPDEQLMHGGSFTAGLTGTPDRPTPRFNPEQAAAYDKFMAANPKATVQQVEDLVFSLIGVRPTNAAAIVEARDKGGRVAPGSGARFTPDGPDRTVNERVHMLAGDAVAGVGDLLDMIELGNPVGFGKHMAESIIGPELHAEVIKRYGQEEGERRWPQIRERAYGNRQWGDWARDLTGAPEPETMGERITSSVVRGATGGALTGGVTGLASGGRNIVRNVLVDAAAGGGGGAGMEVGREIGGEPGALIGALVAGGLSYAAAARLSRVDPEAAVELARRFAADERGSVPAGPGEPPARARKIDRIDIKAPARGQLLDLAADDLPETRGRGAQYHGTRGQLPELQEGYYNPANIYGGMNTFYTTDAMDIASGYGRKSRAARVYAATEKQPVNFFDMEQPIDAAELEAIFGVGPDDLGLTPTAIDEAATGGMASLRQVMDEIRASSAGEGVSRDEVQEIFDAAIWNLQERGFGGMTHVGGQRTNRPPHAVKIYFDAPNQLSFTEVARQGANRPIDRIDINDIPRGWAIEHDPRIGRVRPMGEQASAGDIAAAAERMLPEDVTPIPSNAVESPDELPTSIQQIEGPGSPGRAPRKPVGFGDHLRDVLKAETERRGVTVRIDAEQAIDAGVPADLIYHNPGVADKKQLRLRNPSLFGTRYGAMTSKQQVLRSLDMDDIDPVDWGFDAKAGERLDREEIGDLLRRDLEGDPTARQRGEDYDKWMAHQRGTEAQAEFAGRYPEGAPYERRGEPISADDLAANQPPTSAYEDVVRQTGKVANINLANIESWGGIRRALQNVEAQFGGFDAARRGEISHEQTLALAADLKLTPDDLLKRRKGQALNAEQAVAARQILAKSADELVALAQKAKGGSDEQLVAFRKALVRHAAIQEQVTGATAEAGRSLQSFRIKAKASAVRLRVMQGLVEEAGGRESIEDIAERILELQRDPAKLNSFARLATNPRLRDKFSELYINGMLSNPATHIVNTVSNLLTAFAQLPEHMTAGSIGAGRRALSLGKAERVTFSEVGARAAGMLSAIPDGFAEAWRVFKTEQPVDWVTKAELAGRQNIKGAKGRVIRVPTRAMSAEDEFFKALARNASVRGLAVRKAHAAGLRGDELKARAADLAANPTDEMIEESFNYARYLTFQDKLGPIASGLMRASNDLPALKVVVPFIRTPTNLLKFAVERSPAAPLLKRWRDDFRAGGARRDVAIARAVVGTGAGMAIYLLAKQGIITGSGPADDNARKLMLANGWQPFSVKIGDSYHSYSRMDPFATTFGIAADFATKTDHLTDKQREDAATVLVSSILAQMEDKTWLSGISDLFSALKDEGRTADTFVAGVAGSFVPAVVANAARAVDPVMRDTRQTEGLPDMLGAPYARLQSRIPGLSDNLPARLDVFGRPIAVEGVPGIVSPFRFSSDKNDPLLEEMLSIGAKFGTPRASVGGPAEQRAYQALAGRFQYEDIGKAMADPAWQAMTKDERRKWVDDIKRDANKAARQELGLEKSRRLPAGFQVEALPKGFVVESVPAR